MKVFILVAVLLLVIAGGSFYFISNRQAYVAPSAPEVEELADVAPTSTEALPSEQVTEVENPGRTIIGESRAGNDITAYHYGEGEEEVLLIAGVHGAYSANTSALAHELRAYLESKADIPKNLRITIIPVLNPDGLKKVAGITDVVDEAGRYIYEAPKDHSSTVPGRFNASTVDLNRNFDCDWKETSTWRSQTVNGGDAPFSEPEARAIKEYVEKSDPVAAIVWFSAEGKVYPSACGGKPGAASMKLANTFAAAADYPVELEFDAYTINGDMVNWFAKVSIPAISVLLGDYDSLELNKNTAGLDAVLKSLGN